MGFEGMTEEQALDMLFEKASIPEKNFRLERINLEGTLKGLSSKEVSRLREQCTTKTKGRGGKMEENFDGDMFNCEIIAIATTRLAVVVKTGKTVKVDGENVEERKTIVSFPDCWKDAKLLSRFKLSSSGEAIKRILLAGEQAALAEVVLDLAGFNIEVDDVKN